MSALLVILNGPIASGKSAVARALGQEFRERGRTAAVIDVDLLYEMLDHHSPMADDASWRLARRAAAALADGFWPSGIELMVVEGPFWDVEERAAFLDHLTTEARPQVVTLRVSFPEALRRVQADPTRRVSRESTFLARNHASFEAAFSRLGATDLVVDTEKTPPGALAACLATRLVDTGSIHAEPEITS